MIAVTPILALLLPLAALGDEIDNGVVGTPVINCQEGFVDFTVQTQKPFVGRIYTEGFQGKDGCAVEAFSPMGNEVHLRLNTNDCGMQKQRMTEPIVGMAFTVGLIVSFHGVFITKVDRAYAIQCYFEQEKALVTSGVEVSAIPPKQITGVDRRKQCFYTVHSGSESGPVARYASVGDQLWHKWECTDKSKGILIHSCKGTDGRGHEFTFYDERGCTVDPIIMPQITYGAGGRSAVVESHAFKFSDRETLNLECLVSMCDNCAGISPPDCGERRGKRGAVESLGSLPAGTFDTLTKLRVFDLYDEDGRIASSVLSNDTLGGVKSGRTCLAMGHFVLLCVLGSVVGMVALFTTLLLFRFRGRSLTLV